MGNWENRARKLDSRKKQRGFKTHNKGMANLHANIASKRSAEADVVLDKINRLTKGKVYLYGDEHSPENTQEFRGPKGARFYYSDQSGGGEVQQSPDISSLNSREIDDNTLQILQKQSAVWKQYAEKFGDENSVNAAWLFDELVGDIQDSHIPRRLKFISSDRGIENVAEFRDVKKNNAYYIDVLASSPLNQVGSRDRRPGGGNKLLYDICREAVDNNKDYIKLTTLDAAKPYYLQNGFRESQTEGDMILSRDGIMSFVKQYESKLGKAIDIEPVAIPEGSNIRKEFGMAADVNTPTFGGGSRKIRDRIKMILGKSQNQIDDIHGEAKQVVPKTHIQRRVLHEVEYFDDDNLKKSLILYEEGDKYFVEVI
jgi:hypothetical protein